MAFTTNFGIEYEESNEGYNCHYREDGQQDAVRVFTMNFDEYPFFCADLLGFSFVDSDNGGMLNRILPAAHPRHPWLFAVEAELIEPHPGFPFREYYGIPTEFPPLQASSNGGDIGGDPPWPGLFTPPQYYGTQEVFGVLDARTSTSQSSTGFAKVQVTYRSLNYRMKKNRDTWANASSLGSGIVAGELQRYMIRTSTYAVENVTLPAGGVAFAEPANANGMEQFPANGFKIFPNKELTYTWKDVPTFVDDGKIPSTLEGHIEAAQGTVNSEWFDGRYAPGTILFQTAAEKPMFNAAGFPVFEISYKWAYRSNPDSSGNPQGWNFFFRYKTGEFEQAFLVINGAIDNTRPLFTSYDHNKLFQIY